MPIPCKLPLPLLDFDDDDDDDRGVTSHCKLPLPVLDFDDDDDRGGYTPLQATINHYDDMHMGFHAIWRCW